ncbi:hypothetical protein ABPG75_013741 [Micractinium tetrahymenae]
MGVSRTQQGRSGPVRAWAFAAPRLEVDGMPGTGKRHYPDPQHGQYEPRRVPAEEAARHHDMMSTEECYRLFPLMIHTSVPLHIEDPEPAGCSASRLSDAGPATGRRRRPAPADSPARAHSQVLPYPATHPTDLRREWLARHRPEELLGAQRRPAA